MKNGINKPFKIGIPVYTLDTNALIYYIGADPAATRIVEDILRQSAPAYVSTVTVLELFSPRDLSEEERTGIESILDTLFVIPLDMDLAREAGELRSLYRLKTADSAIAATALRTRSMLVTRNVKDFQPVPGLRLLEV